MNRYQLVVLIFLFALPLQAQRAAFAKLSPTLRQWVRSQDGFMTTRSSGRDWRQVISFMRAQGDPVELLSRHGGRCLARKGTLSIVSVPLSQVGALSLEPRVRRLEAEPSRNRVSLDSTALHINALPVYAGTALPQAFTGKGVMVGVMDIGFDLTHPTFYDKSLTRYRVCALWDQLATDTIGSTFPVGRDYRGTDNLLALGCPRDGLIQTHGTHTAGIAAGSGAGSPYRGLAWESELCLVANATTDDISIIDSADYYRYTFATDALGFKYIFDTADSLGMPCVINFSEGSTEDFYGYDQLYYEMLDSLVGPGHIIVSSAGNTGNIPTYLCKAASEESDGAFMSSSDSIVSLTLKADGEFVLKTTVYAGVGTSVFSIPTDSILARQDSLYQDTLRVGSRHLALSIQAYPNCYAPGRETVYDVEVTSSPAIASLGDLSFEAVGQGTTVEFFRGNGWFTTSSRNPSLSQAECSHTINSPASSPRVICVGSSGYRTQFVNYNGETHVYNRATGGRRCDYSSVGPTYDGRMKPDCLAPGNNIISSYSSFYLEHNPDASDIYSDVEHFTWNGRTYAWNSNSGTSMASPVVAGVIALWLQANPRLTPEDVLQVLRETSTHTDDRLNYPNTTDGYGQIDAYKGLLQVLGLTRIASISTRQASHFRLSSTAEGVELLPLETVTNPFMVRIYSVSGQLLLSRRCLPGSTSYRLPLSARGVLAVQVDGDGSTLIRR